MEAGQCWEPTIAEIPAEIPAAAAAQGWAQRQAAAAAGLAVMAAEAPQTVQVTPRTADPPLRRYLQDPEPAVTAQPHQVALAAVAEAAVLRS